MAQIANKNADNNTKEPQINTKYIEENGSHASGKSFQSQGGSMDALTQDLSSFDTHKLNEVLNTFRSLDKSVFNQNDVLNGTGSQREQYHIGRSEFENQNALLKLQKSFKKRIFKLNFALLELSIINFPFYFIIVTMEFFQLFWLVYYFVICRNGFAEMKISRLNTSGYIPKLVEQLYDNSAPQANYSFVNITEDEFQLTKMIQSAQTALILDTTFRMDDLTKWSNPALYFIDTDYSGKDAVEGVSGSNKAFFTTYGVACALFYFMLFTNLIFANTFFKAVKQENYQESVKIIIKILSTLQFLFLSYLAVPFMTLLFQAFQCDEDPLLQYTQQGVSCDGTDHKFLVIFSSVTLLIYGIFMLMQLTLFQSIDIDSTIPWSSFDRHVSLTRLVIKIMLTCSFIFDKPANAKPQVVLACLVLMLYILFRRFTDAIIFNYFMHVVSTCMDVLIANHMFFVSLHILIISRQSVSTVFIFLLNSVVFMIFYTVAQEHRRISLLEREGYVKYASASGCEIYFFRELELIQRNSMGDQMFIHGKIAIHMDDCSNPKCECANIINKFDIITKNIEVQEKFQMQQQSTIRKQETEGERGTQGDYGSLHINLQKFATNEQNLNSHSPRSQDGEKIAEAGLYTILQSQMPGNIQNTPHDLMKNEEAQNQQFNSTSLVPIQKRKISVRSTLQGKFAKVLQLYVHDQQEEEQQDEQKLQELFFRFLSIQINHVLSKYPKNVTLRLLLAYLFKSKLGNQFKAIFELIQCEEFDLTMFEQFIVFKRKEEIELELQRQHQKQILKTGQIDVTILFEHQRYVIPFIIINKCLQSLPFIFIKRGFGHSCCSLLLERATSEKLQCHKTEELWNRNLPMFATNQ